MTKTLLTGTALLMLFLNTSLLGQVGVTTDYLVLATGDTLPGTVEHIDERGVSPKYYKKIRFTGSNGKLKKHKRETVSAFRSKGNIYEGFWLSQSSEKILLVNPRYDIESKKGEQHFLRVVSKGKLSHYQLEWWEQGESLQLSMDLLKKEKDKFFIRATQGLLGLKRRVLGQYFQDCPGLQDKIKQKELKTVHEVINFYNNDCVGRG